MNKEKLTKEVKEFFGDERLKEFEEFKNFDAEDVVSLIHYLNAEDLIDFDFTEIQSDCDYWIEASVCLNLKLEKGIGKHVGITFDYDVRIYRDEDIEELIDSIINLEEYAQIILKALDPVKYKGKK